MGLLRIILALSVFAAHAYDAFGGGARLMDWHSPASRNGMHLYVWSGHAVFAFFILSGFYMAMVINEKYSKMPDGTRRFYFNRALRLYPANWVILAGFALVYVASGTPSFLTFTHGESWMTPIAFFCNLFFFGAEILPFKHPQNWQYVIGPIWSLSLEAYFYILAPFIVTRSLKSIALLAAASAALRLTLYHTGVGPEPWRYFFFPSDLVFFLMGVIAYRLFACVKDAAWTKPAGIFAAAVIFGLIAFPPFWKYASNLDCWQSWAFYLTVAAGTPFLFSLTKNSAIDNFIGQLSYPVYLGHILVFSAMLCFYNGPMDKGLLSLILTFIMAVGIYLAVDKPIDSIRHNIARRRAPAQEPQPDRTAPVLPTEPSGTRSGQSGLRSS
jgi:peptidoglycan/LPS O-acetylase OafA/YrhL